MAHPAFLCRHWLVRSPALPIIAATLRHTLKAAKRKKKAAKKKKQKEKRAMMGGDSGSADDTKSPETSPAASPSHSPSSETASPPAATMTAAMDTTASIARGCVPELATGSTDELLKRNDAHVDFLAQSGSILELAARLDMCDEGEGAEDGVDFRMVSMPPLLSPGSVRYA